MDILGWAWAALGPRDDEAASLWRRQFGGDFNKDGRADAYRGFRFQGNSTTSLREELLFASAKSIRTSTIILAVFNVIAAFATVAGIIWDGWAREKRNNPNFKFRSSGFNFIGPAETFPLVLSCGIVIQGIVFAVAQSTGLEGTLVLGCTITSQLMLPAVLIPSYIQLIFGVETAVRGFQKQPFQPKSKWTVTICLATIGGLLAVSYIVTHFVRPGNLCFGSLFFFLEDFATGIFILLLVIAVILTGTTVIVFMKLHKTWGIDPTERVAASRMVYYMGVGVILAALLLPFFATLAFDDGDGSRNTSLQLSMLSSVVSNVLGLMTGGLHLFFRSNTLSSIGPKGGDKSGCNEVEKQNFKRGIRLWSPREASSDPASRRLGIPIGQASKLQRMNSVDTLLGSDRALGEKQYEAASERVNPLRSNAVFSDGAHDDLKAPEPVMAKSQHGRKGSYSLFPGSMPTSKSVPIVTEYDEATKDAFNTSDLKPPPAVSALRHRRDSSMASHATVQIGLRLSNVDDMPPLDSRYFDSSKVHHLDCPNAINNALSPTKRPSPLGTRHPGRVDDDDNNDDSSSTYSRESADQSSKTLPGAPGELQKEDCTLSPVVYNPNSQTKAAKVGQSSQRGLRQNRQGDWV